MPTAQQLLERLRSRGKLLSAVAALGVALWITVALGWFRADGWLYGWQTLVSGFLAIFAALVGGAFVLSQVRQSEAQENERLRRRHEAARAVMPMTLSALMDYARGCGRALRILHQSTAAQSVPRGNFEPFQLPPIPESALPGLAGMIEATERDVADAIAALLRTLQVQHGRLRSMREEALDPHGLRRSVPKVEIEDYILDVAAVHARCERLLDFARNESQTVEPEPQLADINRALFLMSYHSATFDRVKARAVHRYGPVVAPIDVG